MGFVHTLGLRVLHPTREQRDGIGTGLFFGEVMFGIVDTVVQRG